MARKNFNGSQIIFRPSQPKDAEIAGRLLLVTFPKKATFMIGLGSEGRAKEILTNLFPIAGHRLSYSHAEVAILDEKVIGISIAYPGRIMGQLNRKLYGLILQQYSLLRKFTLIRRALPQIFMEETTRSEFFMSNLAVSKRFRGHGVGEEMLRRVESRAKALNLPQVGLICAIENRDARRFYERHGYAVVAMHLESNQRVPYLGPGTQRMVKELD